MDYQRIIDRVREDFSKLQALNLSPEEMDGHRGLVIRELEGRAREARGEADRQAEAELMGEAQRIRQDMYSPS